MLFYQKGQHITDRDELPSISDTFCILKMKNLKTLPKNAPLPTLNKKVDKFYEKIEKKKTKKLKFF